MLFYFNLSNYWFSFKYFLNLDFCQECCRERQKFEYSSQFTYVNESLYVRKVTEETMALFAQTLAISSVSSTFVTAVDAESNADESDDAQLVNVGYNLEVCFLFFSVSCFMLLLFVHHFSIHYTVVTRKLRHPMFW